MDKKIRACKDCGYAILQYLAADTTALSGGVGMITKEGVENQVTRLECWGCGRIYKTKEINELPLIEA